MKSLVFDALRNAICIVFTCSFFACESTPAKRVFPEMKERYADIKFSTDSYFLKNFGLSHKSYHQSAHFFRRLNSDTNAFFHLTGFLTQIGKKVIMVKELKSFDRDTGTILFDFDAQLHQPWIYNYSIGKKIHLRDSVELISKEFLINDTFYTFRLQPHYFFLKNKRVFTKDHCFDVTINEQKGVVSILCSTLSTLDTLVYVRLYPTLLVRNKMGQALLL